MKVAILTTFMGFPEAYSLTGIVEDQVSMFLKHGVDVDLIVNKMFNHEDKPKLSYTGPGTLNIKPLLPFAHLKDYTSVKNLSTEHAKIPEIMTERLKDTVQGADIVLTHDIVFTGWNLPYALGVKELSKVTDTKWLHWIHSVPSTMRDWWNIYEFGTKKHRLVFPNIADKTRVAEQYRGLPQHVKIIPHIKDPRSWWDFHEDTKKLIGEIPGFMSSDIVCIYPASSDRLEAKQLDIVIDIMGYLKRMGNTVTLFCATQWANSKAFRDEKNEYINQALDNGLTPADFVFSTDVLDGLFTLGVTRTTLRELLLLSNLFIFPTREESFGLAAVEAALSGCLMVHNSSLPSQAAIHEHTGMYVDFGSFCSTLHITDRNAYLHDVAVLIKGAMEQDDALKSKTHVRKKLNMDYLFFHYYAPTISESCRWE